MSLVSVADLAAHLGSTVEDLPGDSQATLDAAVSELQEVLGWPVGRRSRVTATGVGDGSTLLMLPTLWLTEVHSITDVATSADVTGWWFDSSGYITRTGGVWALGTRYQVTFSDGYLSCPAALAAVILRSVALRMRTPVGVRSQTIGAYAVSFDSGSGGFTSAGDAAVLDRYRLQVRP